MAFVLFWTYWLFSVEKIGKILNKSSSDLLSDHAGMLHRLLPVCVFVLQRKQNLLEVRVILVPDKRLKHLQRKPKRAKKSC